MITENDSFFMVSVLFLFEQQQTQCNEKEKKRGKKRDKKRRKRGKSVK